jgi:hypothetical protein
LNDASICEAICVQAVSNSASEKPDTNDAPADADADEDDEDDTDATLSIVAETLVATPSVTLISDMPEALLWEIPRKRANPNAENAWT